MAWSRLIYPHLCLHCEQPIKGRGRKLCACCAEQLELLDASRRCAICFAEAGTCSGCWKRMAPLRAIAAAFEYEGAVKTLVRHFKFHDAPELGRGAAAWMAMQLLRLSWPLPDLIVSVPQTPWHAWARGYNQSEVLAQELSRIVHRPACSLLRRQSGGASQSRLPRALRLQLSEDAFSWKRRRAIADQVVLLVDDVMTTGSTLRACAAVLGEGYPKALYGLALAGAF
jgi:ComF family protein